MSSSPKSPNRLLIRYYRRFSWLRRSITWFLRVQIPLFGGLPLQSVVKFFTSHLKNEPLALRSSAIAFNLFLAIFPFLISIFTLIPYLPIDHLSENVMGFMKEVMPGSAYTTIETTLLGVLEDRNSSLLSFSFIGAFYFASSGMNSLMGALNTDDRRGYWSLKWNSLKLTFAIGFVGLVVASLFILTKLFLSKFADRSKNLDAVLVFIAQPLQWLVMLIMIFFAIIVTYRISDDDKVRWKFLLPGAVVATFLVFGVSTGYGWYVSNFTNYNKLYGSLGALIITMLWLNFNSMVVIIGSDLNQSLLKARELKLSKTRGPIPLRS